jgi:fatty acid synthase subunit alpha
MAKRTQATRFAASDASQGLKREFFGCLKDIDSVYYQSKVIEEDHVPVDEKNSNAKSPTTLVEVTTQSTPAKSQAQTFRIPDAPISAIDVIKTLLAIKFKKSPSEIPGSSTIKILAGGKCLCLRYGWH